MVKEVNFEDVKRDVIHAFTNGCMCSESVITIANKHWDLGMGDDIMAIATGFPFGFGDGGIGNLAVFQRKALLLRILILRRRGLGGGNAGSFTRKRHTFPVCQTSAKR